MSQDMSRWIHLIEHCWAGTQVQTPEGWKVVRLVKRDDCPQC